MVLPVVLVLAAEAVERVFRKEWAKAMEKKLSFKEKRSLMAVMTRLLNDKAYVLLFVCLATSFILPSAS